MKLQRLVVGLVVGLAMLGASAVQAAPITVDSFTTPFAPSPLTPANSPQVQGPGFFLGTRKSTFGGVGPVDPIFDGVVIGGGVLSFSTVALDGTLALDYSAFGTLDLAGRPVEVPFTFYDPSGAVATDVRVELFTLAGLLSETQLTTNVFDPDGFLLSFSSFAGPGNISQVTGIRITFNANGGEPGLDFKLGDSGIRIQEVPEPSTLALLGLASLGMAVYGRRKLLGERAA